MGRGRLVSKRVRVLDCNCSNFSTQGSADRFDFCECETRVERGKRHAIEVSGEKFHLGTVFIAAYPNMAFGEGMQMEKKPVPVMGYPTSSGKKWVTEIRG
jgi:hypothetical protein